MTDIGDLEDDFTYSARIYERLFSTMQSSIDGRVGKIQVTATK